MGKISSVDPATLREPGNMNECVIAKCHAVNQCILIDAELKRYRALRRKWNKRLGACLRKMSVLALKEGKP